MRKLVLFDIDGTLVLTGAAGLRAMNTACAELVGHAEALDGIPVAGRTDRIILSRRGGSSRPNTRCRAPGGTAWALRREPSTTRSSCPGRGTKAVMPGVRALLDTLVGSRRRVRRTADRQLRGRCADQARTLRPVALLPLRRVRRRCRRSQCAGARSHCERARGCGLPDLAPEHILVVGDTPHDIACARAVGAVPVGVATGTFTVEQLRATGAEIVFKDLSDTDAFLALLKP